MSDRDDRYSTVHKGNPYPPRYRRPSTTVDTIRDKLRPVALDCGHIVRFAEPLPKPGALHYCFACRIDTRIDTTKKES